MITCRSLKKSKMCKTQRINKTRQDKTRQDKTIQDKTRQDKTKMKNENKIKLPRMWKSAIFMKVNISINQ